MSATILKEIAAEAVLAPLAVTAVVTVALTAASFGLRDNLSRVLKAAAAKEAVTAVGAETWV